MSSIERVWRERVMEWQQSGMSQTAYCRGKAYSSHSLSSWVRRFAEGSPQAVLVKPVVTPSRPSSGGAIVVEHGAIRVTISGDTDLALLQRVLTALAGAAR